MLLAENFDQGLADPCRRGRHLDAGALHGGGLGFRVALAAGNDRAGVAHAAAWRGGAACDEAGHRLLAALLGFVDQELRGVFFGGAADLADHHDRLGLGIGEEELKAFDEIHALDRIAADAERGGLAEPFARGLEHRLIGERAGARHNADLPGLKILPGMMPILHSPAVITPGQFGPTRRDLDPASERFTLTMSATGMPSVMQMISSISASMASAIASAAPGGGT